MTTNDKSEITELIVTVNAGKVDDVARGIDNLNIRKGTGIVVKSKLYELDTIIVDMNLKDFIQLIFVKDITHITTSDSVSLLSGRKIC
jgi:hypothetical protein